MIKKDEVFKIGIFNKPHGVKGEISFTFTDDIFDRVECEYLVCLLDGIFVPFFIEEYRFRSDTTALVKLEGVDTSEKARMFTNVEVYFPKKYVGEEEDSDDIPTWNYFIGFKVEDVNHGELGEIVAVDDVRCMSFLPLRKVVRNFCCLPTRNLSPNWIRKSVC